MTLQQSQRARLSEIQNETLASVDLTDGIEDSRPTDGDRFA